jgi:hypothetical protein
MLIGALCQLYAKVRTNAGRFAGSYRDAFNHGVLAAH